jgi:hypothetical protein
MAAEQTRRKASMGVFAIDWDVEPPQSARRGQRKRVFELEPLLDKPGRQARVAVYEKESAAQSMAQTLRRDAPALLGGKWEIHSHKQEDGSIGIWATFLGAK